LGRIAAVIAVDSLNKDSCNLPRVFVQLRNMFGYFPNQTIIVLATKKNTVNQQ
jgi:hypothetical protein